MTKDYYKILGVTEFDTADNIKLAYRKMARKWHPDIAGNSFEALERFKEINEAYEVLSNKTKKDDYDRARRFYSYAKDSSCENKSQTNEKTYGNTKKYSEEKSSANNPSKKGFSFNWEDFINKKQRETSFKKDEKICPQKGEDVYTDVEISILDSIRGTVKVINMLQTGICPKCGGKKFINGGLCRFCKGKGEHSDYKKFTVKIPAGIKDNSKIRLANEGGKGINGGTNGDFYITVHIQKYQNYSTDGLNILKTVPITPYEAVLGANIKIQTINGEFSVKLAPNTQNGQKIRLSGCGIMQNETVGDMIITVEIQIPKNLTPEEVELYKKLEQISSNNIRDNIYDR